MDQLIVFVAKYFIVLVVLGIAWVWVRLPKSRRWQAAVTIVGAGVLALILAKLGSKLFYDTRPFVSQGIKPLLPHAADNGFPSDHALFTMTLTAAAFLYNKKVAWAMLVATVAVGVARVMAHVHSPIDILGAWVIAVVATLASHYLVKRFWPR